MGTMRTELDREEMAFTRVAAIDGRHRSAGSFPQYQKKRAVGFLGRELLSGEVGTNPLTGDAHQWPPRV